MFQWISITGISGVVGAVLLHALFFSCGSGSRFSPIGWIRRAVHLFSLLFLEQRLTLVGKFRKLAYLLAMLSVMVLTLTGFGPVVLGLRISGWLLMIHATFAGVFVCCMAFLAITWAGAFTCDSRPDDSRICSVESFVRKAGFWVLVILTLPIALTMVLSMYPIFGTYGQEMMLWIHRYCTLSFVMTAVVQTYLVIRSLVIRDNQT